MSVKLYRVVEIPEGTLKYEAVVYISGCRQVQTVETVAKRLQRSPQTIGKIPQRCAQDKLLISSKVVVRGRKVLGYSLHPNAMIEHETIEW